MIDPSFQSIADYRKLLPHERLQTGTRAAFQEKKHRTILMDRPVKKDITPCFSAEAGEVQRRVPLKNDIFEPVLTDIYLWYFISLCIFGNTG